jgi:hypothetical protein
MHYTVLVVNENDRHWDSAELLDMYSDKWDWYVLGGRWTGLLTLLPGSQGELGEPGVQTNPAEEGTADQAFVQDIDLSKLEQTYCFIDRNGGWHEPDDFWAGARTDESVAQYQREWDLMIASLQPNDLLSVYDCHY